MRDDWGKDPSVQNMRRVFGHMEAAQGKLLGRLNISPYDNRLRRWREKARTLFDQACIQTARRGAVLNEEDAALIYLHCLEKVLSLDGIEISGDALSRDVDVLSLSSEGKT